MSDVTIVYCRPCGYEKKAQEAAAGLKERLAVDARLIPGTGGIFEVKVGSEIAVKRSKGHFPGTAEIVAAVQRLRN